MGLTINYTSRNQSILPSGSQTFDTIEELRQWFCTYAEGTTTYNGTQINTLELSGMSIDDDASYLFSATYGPGSSTKVFNASSINLTNWNSSLVKSWYYMFNENTSLTEVIGLNQRAVTETPFQSATDMSYMFYNCTNLSKIDLSGITAPNLTTMFFLACGTKSLSELKLDHITAPELNNIEGLIYTSAMTTLDLSYLKTNANLLIANSYSRRKDLANVRRIIFDYAELPNTINIELSQAQNCQYVSLEHMIVSPSSVLYLSKNSTPLSELHMHNTDWSISYIDFSYNPYTSFDFAQILDSYSPSLYLGNFTGCTSLTEIIDTSENGVVHDANCESKPGQYNSMFSNITNLQKIDLKDFSFCIYNGENAFENKTSLEHINLKHIKFTSTDSWSAYGCYSMFAGCTSLETLPKLIFDYNASSSYKITLQSMFEGCTNLKSLTFELNYTNDNPITAENAKQMFKNCSNLEQITVIGTKTFQIDGMESTFEGCLKLKEIPQIFKIRSLSSLQYSFAKTFKDCAELETIDLNFILSNNPQLNKVIYYAEMFSGCEKLTTINCGKTFPILSESEKMDNVFLNCYLLSGAISYDSTRINGAYANPRTGYFTGSGGVRLFINGVECNQLFVNGVECTQLFINGQEIT